MSKDHIHTYRRVDIGKEEPYFVMQCSDAECHHYIKMSSKLSCPQLRGKASVCNRCAEPFILNRRALRMAEPCCDKCVKTKVEVKHKVADAEAFFNNLEEKMGVKP